MPDFYKLVNVLLDWYISRGDKPKIIEQTFRNPRTYKSLYCKYENDDKGYEKFVEEYHKQFTFVHYRSDKLVIYATFTPNPHFYIVEILCDGQCKITPFINRITF
uniref:Uncharacterized protein n=1 Tax=viral metagenome TaxID=1070528 RepID=A0A6C0CK02_9ZZZZ